MNLHLLLRIITPLLLLSCLGTNAYSYNLPSLGDSSSSIVSAQEEYSTGQNWLRAFRRQAPVSTDPLLYSYVDNLVRNLAFHSPLKEKYFSLVIVDSKDFNAFAVPGNVIGINTGLFHYANTEDEIASVIAHELAHLSQRHYARSLNQQKTQGMVTLAALLGSLLIMAAGDAESGMAAMTATQAAAIDNRLKYSRTQEEEADRIGMQTLANADMNPESIAHMFQHMLVKTRYRTDIREFDFLLTHPLADSRVSNALNQARQYPKRNDKDSFDFHLMKARAHFLASKNLPQTIEFFRNETPVAKFPAASQYGLALALLASGELKESETIINSLYQSNPHQTSFVIAKADLYIQQKHPDKAANLLKEEMAFSPDNYPLSMKAANFYLHNNQPDQAVKILRSLVASGKPDTPDVWYLLAEVEGLAGNIADVHLARAEYFVRLGGLTQAQRHLYLALPLLEGNLQAKSRAQLRINDIEKLKQEAQF
jgi:beta-barrel assembly-enhancing protease